MEYPSVQWVVQQPIKLVGLNGTTLEWPLRILNEGIHDSLFEAVYLSFGLGFASILLLIIVITKLTDPIKFRRPGFILNFIALCLFCVYNILALPIFVGLSSTYGIAEKLIPGVRREIQGAAGWKARHSIGYLSCFVQGCMYMCILTSLILQVRVVFIDRPRFRRIMTLVLAAMALGVEGCFMAFKGYLIIHSNFNDYAPPTLDTLTIPIKQIFNASFVALVSICCALFLYKLFLIIHASWGIRGFLKFGHLQLLFFTSLACLIVPGTPPPPHFSRLIPVTLLILQITTHTNLISYITVFLVSTLPIPSTCQSKEFDEAVNTLATRSRASRVTAGSLVSVGTINTATTVPTPGSKYSSRRSSLSWMPPYLLVPQGFVLPEVGHSFEFDEA
jgi:hypothetical protein